MRLALVLAVTLAACASPGSGPAPASPLPGGLTADRAASLRGLGVPVVVPGDVGRFRIDDMGADRMDGDGFVSVGYRIHYRRDDGACFEVAGTNEGLGGPAYPLVSQPVRLAALPGAPTVDLYQAAADPAASSAQAWGPGTVISNTVEVDGLVARFRSTDEDGCRPLPLAEAVPLFAGLRLLPAGAAAGPPAPGPPRPPSADALENLGTFADAPGVRDDPAIESGTSPEDAAHGLADRYTEARSVEVQVVQAVGDEATVLVTATGLGDDSLDGERYRLRYRQGEDGTWFIEDAGVQVRCHAGRGHTDWAPTPCS